MTYSLVPNRPGSSELPRPNTLSRLGSLVAAAAATVLLAATFAAFFPTSASARDRAPVGGPVQVLPTVQVTARV